jgi:hypothetical protein
MMVEHGCMCAKETSTYQHQRKSTAFGFFTMSHDDAYDLTATVDAYVVPLAKKLEEKIVFPSSPKCTMYNIQ